MGDLKGNLLNRNRGKSDDVGDIFKNQVKKLEKQDSNDLSGSEVCNWRNINFETLDERIVCFLDLVHEHSENQSQLIAEFHDFYLCRSEKPQISEE